MLRYSIQLALVRCLLVAAPAGEGHMHVWRNHLVAGCVDKSSFGKHGLLHVIYVSSPAWL